MSKAIAFSIFLIVCLPLHGRPQSFGKGLDISNNYWDGPDPSGSSADWPDFNFSAASGPSSESTPPFSCGGGYDGDRTKESLKRPEQSQSLDTCLNADALCEQWASGLNGTRDLAYDTIRWFVMHCYQTSESLLGLVDAGSVAGGDSGQSLTSHGALIRSAYRAWILDTVIRLRSDNDWFCLSVHDLTGAYSNFIDIPSILAILQFVADNPRCDSARSDFGSAYALERMDQIHLWQDTAKNDSMKYFDSTLPSMHQLGLDTLLNMASVAYYDATGPQIITDAHLTINPTSTSTAISLTTNREAYLHIGLYDLLGRKLEGVGYDGVFEPGSRTVPLQTSALASGTYYLRVSTANNEVRTLKLVKTE